MTIQQATSFEPRPKSSLSIWNIDTSHASAAFKVRHLMVSHVRGTLGPVSGSVHLDERDITRSIVRATIDARGLETKEAKRDEHLRSADFLDVEHHPFVTFDSTEVRQTSDGKLEVTGDLTIRGVTRSVVLEVEQLTPAVTDPWGNVKRGVTARTSIDRKDFGLSWNALLETGGVVVGDTVSIEIDVELALAA